MKLRVFVHLKFKKIRVKIKYTLKKYLVLQIDNFE